MKSLGKFFFKCCLGGSVGSCSWPSHHLATQASLPRRKEQLLALKNDVFDVLVIGGGAAGCGCALDAATRGLKTALVEASDFGSGSSSKSSKLINAAAPFGLGRKDSKEQYILLQNAPHLCQPLPMLAPMYSQWNLCTKWLGGKLSDFASGEHNLGASHFLTKQTTLNEFPLLRAEGLLGSLVSYRSLVNDARLCLALAMTAAQYGAVVANYVEVVATVKPDDAHRITCVRENEEQGQDEFHITSKCVINATKSCDHGTHLVLPQHFGSLNYGLIASKERNGSLLMVPWNNHIIVTSSDDKSDAEDTGTKSKQPIKDVLGHAVNILGKNVEFLARHISAAWLGTQESKYYRFAPEPQNEGLVDPTDDSLISLLCSQWSSYRHQAKEAVDKAVKSCLVSVEDSECGPCCTENMPLTGAEDWSGRFALELVLCYDLPMDVAQHLSNAYGTNALQLLAPSTSNTRRRLLKDWPYIEAEVVYTCQQEYVCNVIDVIARRLGVAFVSTRAAYEMLPRIVKIMATLHQWDYHTTVKQYSRAKEFISKQTGLSAIRAVEDRPQLKKRNRPKQKEVVQPIYDSNYNRIYALENSMTSTDRLMIPKPKSLLKSSQRCIFENKANKLTSSNMSKDLPRHLATSTGHTKISPSARHSEWRNFFTC